MLYNIQLNAFVQFVIYSDKLPVNVCRCHTGFLQGTNSLYARLHWPVEHNGLYNLKPIVSSRTHGFILYSLQQEILLNTSRF